METIALEFKTALLEFNSEGAKNVLLRLTDHKNELIPQLIEQVLSEIGNEWECGDLALSQVYMSGQICEKIVNEIFANEDFHVLTNHRIAIVTFNDYHVLGKKIVQSILKSVGFQIIDLGSGINIETLVDKIEKGKIEILLISVLMLPSALKIRKLRDVLNEKQLNVRILVGGAPFLFDEHLWEQVGADAMAKTGSAAIDVLNTWIKK